MQRPRHTAPGSEKVNTSFKPSAAVRNNAVGRIGPAGLVFDTCELHAAQQNIRLTTRLTGEEELRLHRGANVTMNWATALMKKTLSDSVSTSGGISM
ncbi:hypothetical protein EYF80_037257 [Liparis tanakae]|uniref:Uncharacterized protein n=1 Tax=Liparis tanakae TaxID=230148 RepID=A0A4Z2GGY6_9TELE|nr:hypothetical protein EYF80_037257 [Liparis tanakae]